MEQIDLKFFKELMLTQQNELSLGSEENKQQAQTVKLDQSAVGRLSRMDAMQKQAMSQETQRRRQLELTKIKSALQRIEGDEYGYCVSCEEVIPVKRLEINPTATLCVRCAEKRE